MKAISEGSDCRCKCVVRPLSRSACRRIEEGSATAQDFYTVETITSGPPCKCSCIAPPSAVNPCEGEFRLKKLREAEKENVKVKQPFFVVLHHLLLFFLLPFVVIVPNNAIYNMSIAKAFGPVWTTLYLQWPR